MFSAVKNIHNPYLKPYKYRSWEGYATFNWCPIDHDGKTYVVYRAMSLHDPLLPDPKQRSVIGIADTTDGLNYENRKEFITPQEDWERFGCEDPRVIKVGDIFYIFYTALSVYPYGPEGTRLAVALSKDMQTVYERHLVTPFNAKAMSLFSDPINGKLTAILTVNTDRPPLPAQIAIAQFDKVEDLWNQDFWNSWYSSLQDHVINMHRRNESDHIEIGGPPIKTDQGWLLIYSYTENFFKYDSRPVTMGIEAALLDINNPKLLLGQTQGPILAPEEYYEKVGYVGNVIFPSGTRLLKDGKLEIYYGAADTTCCKATVNINDLLGSINPKTKEKYYFQRYSKNPILLPTQNIWENKAVFNPAAIDLGGKIHILYRAMGQDDTSTIGYASTVNGFEITERLDYPIYTPRADFELKKRQGNSGCEDPRIVILGDKLHMFYTAYDGENPPRVATTNITIADFLSKTWNWSEPILITPPNVDDKDTCILPEEINGKYLMIHRINNRICADYLPEFDPSRFKVSRCTEMLEARPGMWDGLKVGIASQPIKTDKGWLLFYHGVSQNHNIYRLGVALLNPKNPIEVIARSSDPLFQPEESYELNGIIPNVVFPCGTVVRENTVFIYYGGADTVTGVATMNLDTILNALT